MYFRICCIMSTNPSSGRLQTPPSWGGPCRIMWMPSSEDLTEYLRSGTALGARGGASLSSKIHEANE